MKTLDFYKKQANELLKSTFLTQICWEVSCDNKRFKDNVIEVCRTEENAKALIKDMSKIGYNDLYYRPCVICKDEGIEVTFENLHYFHNDSDFVKNLKKELQEVY